MRHDLRLTAWAALLVLPVFSVAAWALTQVPWSVPARAALLLALFAWCTYALIRLRASVLVPLRTTAGLLQGLREGNYSARARDDDGDDGLGQVLGEVNALAEWLQRQRLTEVEASALLTTVMAELDAAVLAFDGRQALALANPAAARLFGRPIEELLGQSADSLGCQALLDPRPARLVSLDFPNASGRWEVRQSSFRQDGLAHQLVVLNDVTRALREEERAAWRRLIRVLSHELNNSLTPITSIANSLAQFVDRGPLDDGVRDDVRKGLGVIEQRAEGLNRFLRGYATLAKLPFPTLREVEVAPLVARVVALESAPEVTVAGGPVSVLRADPDQVEQLLINLLRNALDAARETGGAVRVEWSVAPRDETVEIRVLDEGPGVAAGADVFVPFFTTKKGGTGIGLALCRQIADAHGGHVALENRRDRTGCVARVRLPRA
jgi:nitrogen fixation/metabolism regulation signal transduction histidine kinase